ncbi:MAG TPA: hypothetical protein VLU25_06635 [Acidobacteriota bacterium]|nr:hypothetical protein [Acidobacteriota bacterium]
MSSSLENPSRPANKERWWELVSALQADEVPFHSPAYVFDLPHLRRVTLESRQILAEMGIELLYTLKAQAAKDPLRVLAEIVDGLSASSPFEARYAREILGNDGSLHYTAPILSDSLLSSSNEIDFLSFNSPSQIERYSHCLTSTNLGLRVNPRHSFLLDDRYDPCCRNSKLGIPVDVLTPPFLKSLGKGITGFHFHNNCDSTDLGQIVKTLLTIQSRSPWLFEISRWINLGGGYRLPGASGQTQLGDLLDEYRSVFNIERFFMEPGAGLIESAGSLFCTVSDIVTSSSIPIAVLDTTVNHLPEAFEYGITYPLLSEVPLGESYLLAGCTCLAGDVFGIYNFEDELRLGDVLCFLETGAYSLVKANYFNGVNLPSIYIAHEDGQIELRKKYDYDDWLRRYKHLTSG